MTTTSSKGVMRWGMIALTGLILTFAHADAQQQPQTSAPNPYLMGTEGLNKGPRGLTSYQPVAIDQTFAAIMAHDVAAKPGIEREHQAMLDERYDLSDHPTQGVTMERGKPLQEGVRVKLPSGVTWEQLAAMSADEIRERGVWPKGFLPLPHPFHPTGGQVFPKEEIEAIKAQDGRDLTRFDVDFDLPERFLAPFPPAMYLTPRPDLGDVSQGKLISLTNFYELLNGILTPRQLEGLRLLLTPFPEQQFNTTEDRKSAMPSLGVACFDCHSNGHQNGAMHLTPDTRPEWFRHRTKTLSLRGLNIQRLFGSQRALKTIEDFTEFEQRTAYFDGDIATAAKKGVNPLEPGGLHGRFRGNAGLSAGTQARCLRQARSGQSDTSRDARAGYLLRQGPMRELPPAAVLHRQPDARSQNGALLQTRNGQLRDDVRGREEQDFRAARSQGQPALPA
jgi:cytochrome c peroxidase